METPDERRQRLYGPVRNLQVEEIRQRLSKSSVLKDGEYNYTPAKLKHVTFGTSYDQDFTVISCNIIFNMLLICKSYYDVIVLLY